MLQLDFPFEGRARPLSKAYAVNTRQGEESRDLLRVLKGKGGSLFQVVLLHLPSERALCVVAVQQDGALRRVQLQRRDARWGEEGPKAAGTVVEEASPGVCLLRVGRAQTPFPVCIGRYLGPSGTASPLCDAFDNLGEVLKRLLAALPRSATPCVGAVLPQRITDV
eukprot:scaffold149_cov315-Pinguiococcus_pyrenoidosus.AAC.134